MLTFERANKLLRYDPCTGGVYWKVRTGNRVHMGDEAGSLLRKHTNTYRQVQIDGRWYRTHRIVWLLHFGVWPEDDLDHIDGEGLNNRIENLRDVTRSENLKNQRMRRNNTSGVTGVCWRKREGKWRAQIRIGGKDKHLGYFTEIEEAAAAYRKAADALGYTERHGTEANNQNGETK